mmetsp:Transcript_143823/g.459580  ORF Transcript_143823/g.459580 Transcript_143823/m.459580 type:complete len:487 (-) Transcript_143823:83-1543(-)
MSPRLWLVALFAAAAVQCTQSTSCCCIPPTGSQAAALCRWHAALGRLTGEEVTWLSGFKGCCMARERTWALGPKLEPGTCPQWVARDLVSSRLAADFLDAFGTPVAQASSSPFDAGTCEVHGGVLAIEVLSRGAYRVSIVVVVLWPIVLAPIFLWAMPFSILAITILIGPWIVPFIDSTCKWVYLAGIVLEVARRHSRSRLPPILYQTLDSLLHEYHEPAVPIVGALCSWLLLGEAYKGVIGMFFLLNSMFHFRAARDRVLGRDNAWTTLAVAWDQVLTFFWLGRVMQNEVAASAAEAKEAMTAAFEAADQKREPEVGKVLVPALRFGLAFLAFSLAFCLREVLCVGALILFARSLDHLAERSAHLGQENPYLPWWASMWINLLVMSVVLAPLLLSKQRRLSSWRTGRLKVSQFWRCLSMRPVPGRQPEAGEECAICCCELLTDEGEEQTPLDFCRWGCGRAVHHHCMAAWREKRDECVFCHALWS